jgi:hypothetical protein
LGLVTITHPFHPLCGQQVEIIRIRWGADPDLIVRLSDGLHAAVAVDWTDYTASTDLDPPTVSPHLLDFDGLCQAVQLIDRIHQESRHSAMNDQDKICAPSGDEL